MENDAAIGYYAPDSRSWIDRLWSYLGYGRAYVPRPDDTDGFAESYMLTNVITRLDWRDRCRALISGKVSVQTLTKTDVPVGRSHSISSFKVLPPNYR